MSRQEILALVALASSSYPSMQSRDPRPIVAAWTVMLAALDATLVKAAIIKVCRESPFFPSVAQIVAASRELDARNEKLPTAAEAWEEVSRLIQYVGPYRAPQYSCDLVRRAARAIGWRQLCLGENPEADRAHFFKIYDALRVRHQAEQENEAVLALSGAADLIRALAAGLSAKK